MPVGNPRGNSVEQVRRNEDRRLPDPVRGQPPRLNNAPSGVPPLLAVEHCRMASDKDGAAAPVSAVATFRETLVAGGYVAEVRKPTAKHYRPSLSDHCPTETVRPLSHQICPTIVPPKLSKTSPIYKKRNMAFHRADSIRENGPVGTSHSFSDLLCFAFALVRMTPR